MSNKWRTVFGTVFIEGRGINRVDLKESLGCIDNRVEGAYVASDVRANRLFFATESMF